MVGDKSTSRQVRVGGRVVDYKDGVRLPMDFLGRYRATIILKKRSFNRLKRTQLMQFRISESHHDMRDPALNLHRTIAP